MMLGELLVKLMTSPRKMSYAEYSTFTIKGFNSSADT